MIGLVAILVLVALFLVFLLLFGFRGAVFLLLLLLALGALFYFFGRRAAERRAPGTPVVLPVEDGLYPDTPDANPELIA